MSKVEERIDTESTSDRLQAALHEQRFEFVLEQFDRVESILEIGTGVGSFSPRLAARCSQYTGLDYDAASALATRQRLVGAGTVVQGDARNLPFPAHSFSVIVCLEVLEHLGEWLAGVESIRRCLRPEGVCVVSVPYRVRGGKSNSNPYHLYEPGRAELTAAFEQRFESVSVWCQYFEETLAMGIARCLHLRRLVGLERPYRVLSAGEEAALARLRDSEDRAWAETAPGPHR